MEFGRSLQLPRRAKTINGWPDICRLAPFTLLERPFHPRRSSWSRSPHRGAQLLRSITPSSVRPFSSLPRLRSGHDFTYHAAAAYAGKDRRFRPDQDIFQLDDSSRRTDPAVEHRRFASNQRRSQRPNSGQDAFFISRVGGSSSNMAFGVVSYSCISFSSSRTKTDDRAT